MACEESTPAGAAGWGVIYVAAYLLWGSHGTSWWWVHAVHAAGVLFASAVLAAALRRHGR